MPHAIQGIKWLNHESEYNVLSRGKHHKKNATLGNTIDITRKELPPPQQNAGTPDDKKQIKSSGPGDNVLEHMSILDTQIAMHAHMNANEITQYIANRRKLGIALSIDGYNLQYVQASPPAKDGDVWGHVYRNKSGRVPEIIGINPHTIKNLLKLYGISES